MEAKKSFSYTLEYPINVDIAGRATDVLSLEVFAPTNQVFSDVNIIDVEYQRARKLALAESTEALKDINPEALKLIEESSKNIKDEERNPLDIVSLMVSNGSDMGKCNFSLCNILCAGNKEKPMCLVDVVKMTRPIYDSLSILDIKRILGLYIINFLDYSRNT